MYRKVSLWIAVFLINFIFQFYRGFDPDLIYFGIAFVLILFENFGLLNWIPELRKVRKKSVYLLPIFTIAFIFIKRESDIGFFLFYLLFVVMFFALWRKNDGGQSSLNRKEIVLARTISTLLVFICIWEILMFTLAKIRDDLWLYPTLSELVVPFLDGLFGRSIFVLCWCAIGIFIIRNWQEQ